MTDEETASNSNDPTVKLSCLVSFSVESLIRHNKITPEEAIRAIASSFWATVVAYSASENFEGNSEFAVSVFETCREAAHFAQGQLDSESEFDRQHHGTQWGTA